jgi:putative ABC transport system permease protein
VALVVGGVGVANTMLISVLERRSEIGLRRALGATRREIGLQFVQESAVLCLAGGVAGTALGAAITAGFAATRGWPTVLPLWTFSAGGGLTVLIGILAGLHPAVRAATVPPTTALASM